MVGFLFGISGSVELCVRTEVYQSQEKRVNFSLGGLCQFGSGFNTAISVLCEMTCHRIQIGVGESDAIADKAKV
jgi:hypothetical protein